MPRKNILTLIISLAVFGLGVFGFFAEARAERFFQKHSTWYEKIPDNPELYNESASFIEDIAVNGRKLCDGCDGFNSLTFDGYGTNDVTPMIIHSSNSDPLVTFQLDYHLHNPYSGINPCIAEYHESLGWNRIRVPAGTPVANAPEPNNDNYMVFINDDTGEMTEVGRTFKVGEEWHASDTRRYNLNIDDGINLADEIEYRTLTGYPNCVADYDAELGYLSVRGESPIKKTMTYDFNGAAQVSGIPLVHGLITWSDWVAFRDNGTRVNHALAFAYSDVPNNTPTSGVYPSLKYNSPSGNGRPNGMHLGMRVQLKKSVNCDAIYNNRASTLMTKLGLMVCYALQDYGMIYTIQPGAGQNSIQLENLHHSVSKWENIPGWNTEKWYQLWAIPINQMQVIEPIMPSSNYSTPTILTPTSGSTLSGSTQVFTWTANNSTVTRWNLFIGTTLGGNDLGEHYNGNPTTTTQTVSNLPTNGSTIYVRLWYETDPGQWSSIDYQYTALTASAQPDINSDGFINIQDFTILLSQWFSNITPGDPADINDDNIVNTRDLGIMMSSWGN